MRRTYQPSALQRRTSVLGVSALVAIAACLNPMPEEFPSERSPGATSSDGSTAGPGYAAGGGGGAGPSSPGSTTGGGAGTGATSIDSGNGGGAGAAGGSGVYDPDSASAPDAGASSPDAGSEADDATP